MASRQRIAVSAALALAVVATFAIGAHHNLPSRRVKTTWAFPSVTPTAVERGCAAWNESLASCVSGSSATEADYKWPER